MGSKGSAQTTTNQTQTYAPAGAGYITNALNQAQNAASLPFNIPQAPVAGFSADQLAAFQNVNKAQGMAQPYINTAAGYFSPQGAQQFLNPYAQNVMANMKDVFGQQQAQTTGQLTQAAGGIGADRIAVGQAELAKQQGLAAGQTMSGLYQNAVQQAQGAGYGTAALGSQAQNAALQGAQAQLGTGGLQQQLAQAQLNAPYQQQLAQAAFPYQQAQFLAGITGSLAPGLGGTTTGQGTTTQPAPSLLSQILGAGTAGAGILGGTGAFGNNGWLTGGNKGTSAGSYGGGGTNYGQAYNIGYGGRSMPVFGRGGVISDANDIDLPNEPDGAGYDDGGSVPNAPIDVAPKSIIPTGQIPAIQAHVPQLNLNPPQQQQQQSGGGGGFGDLLKTGLSIAAMVARGGAIRNPYAFADGGSPSDTDFASLTRGDPAWANPDVGGGYALPPAPKAGFENRWGNFPAAQTDPQFLQQYQNAMGPRIGYDPRIEKAIADNTVPTPQARPAAADATTAVAADELPANAEPTAGAVGATSPNPYARPATTPPDTTGAAAKRDTGFIGSPWAALTAAGLGMMAGTSPYAGVNIGQGAMQGLKTLEAQREQARKDETTDQAAKRLEQEANRHAEDISLRERAQAETERYHRASENTAPTNYRYTAKGELEPIKGGPADPARIKELAEAKSKGPIDDADAKFIAQQYLTGDKSVMVGLARTPENMIKIRHAIREEAENQGLTPSQVALKTAEFAGMTAGQRAAGVAEVRMGMAAQEAAGAIQLGRGAIEKVPRTSFLPFNELIQGYQNRTLNPDQAELYTRTQGIVNAYAAVMQRGANVTTVDARHRAMELLNTAANKEVYNRVLDTMESEIGMALAAPEKMRDVFSKRYGAKQNTESAPAGGQAAPRFTGRTATNPQTGATLRETSDGQWVQ